MFTKIWHIDNLKPLPIPVETSNCVLIQKSVTNLQKLYIILMNYLLESPEQEDKEEVGKRKIYLVNC